MTLDEMLKSHKVGDKFSITNHPSGVRFDGPAKIVEIWWNSFYFGIEAVSDTDTTNRPVKVCLGSR
jgi:hypothetical protein